MDQVKRRCHVHGNHAQVVLDLHRVEWQADPVAGVAHQGFQARQAPNPSHERRDILFLGELGEDNRHPHTTALPKLAGKLPKLGCAPPGEEEVKTVTGETLGIGPADAARRARDTGGCAGVHGHSQYSARTPPRKPGLTFSPR